MRDLSRFVLDKCARLNCGGVKDYVPCSLKNPVTLVGIFSDESLRALVAVRKTSRLNALQSFFPFRLLRLVFGIPAQRRRQSARVAWA